MSTSSYQDNPKLFPVSSASVAIPVSAFPTQITSSLLHISTLPFPTESEQPTYSRAYSAAGMEKAATARRRSATVGSTTSTCFSSSSSYSSLTDLRTGSSQGLEPRFANVVSDSRVDTASDGSKYLPRISTAFSSHLWTDDDDLDAPTPFAAYLSARGDAKVCSEAKQDDAPPPLSLVTAIDEPDTAAVAKTTSAGMVSIEPHHPMQTGADTLSKKRRFKLLHNLLQSRQSQVPSFPLPRSPPSPNRIRQEEHGRDAEPRAANQVRKAKSLQDLATQYRLQAEQRAEWATPPSNAPQRGWPGRRSRSQSQSRSGAPFESRLSTVPPTPTARKAPGTTLMSLPPSNAAFASTGCPASSAVQRDEEETGSTREKKDKRRRTMSFKSVFRWKSDDVPALPPLPMQYKVKSEESRSRHHLTEKKDEGEAEEQWDSVTPMTALPTLDPLPSFTELDVLSPCPPLPRPSLAHMPVEMDIWDSRPSPCLPNLPFASAARTSADEDALIPKQDGLSNGSPKGQDCKMKDFRFPASALRRQDEIAQVAVDPVNPSANTAASCAPDAATALFRPRYLSLSVPKSTTTNQSSFTLPFPFQLPSPTPVPSPLPCRPVQSEQGPSTSMPHAPFLCSTSPPSPLAPLQQDAERCADDFAMGVAF